MTVRLTTALIGIALATLVAVPGSVDAGPPLTAINIASSPITGQAGNVLVATIEPPGGGAALGRICYPIGDPIDGLPDTNFTQMPADDDPCGDPTPDSLLPPGDYTVSAGVFEPGSETPLRSLTAPIGDAGTPLIDGSALSAPALGDTDCDSDVDAVDALNVLRRIAALGPFAVCVELAGNVKCDDDLAATDALFILRFIAALANNYPAGCSPILGAPALLAPADGSIFNNFPREFDVDWEAVPGAAGYVVQVDCLHCCAIGDWCTDAGRGYRTTAGIEETSFVATMGGDNEGRVRVWAVDEDGRPGVPGPWRHFEFDT